MVNTWVGLLGHGDLVAGGGGVLTSSTLAASTSLPLANVASFVISDVARLSGTTSLWVRLVLAAAVPAQLMAIVATNLRATDTVRFRASATTDPTASPLIDSTAISGINPAYGYLYHLAAAEQSCQSFQWDIEASGLADGYVDIGRLWASPVWRPAANYGLGAARQWLDASENHYARRSGARQGVVLARRRSYAVSFEALSEAEADAILDVDRLTGLTDQVCYVHDPSAANTMADVVIGTLRELGAVTMPQLAYQARQIAVQEDL